MSKRCEKCWAERDIPPQNVPVAEIQLFGRWLCRHCHDEYWRNLEIIWSLPIEHPCDGDLGTIPRANAAAAAHWRKVIRSLTASRAAA